MNEKKDVQFLKQACDPDTHFNESAQPLLREIKTLSEELYEKGKNTFAEIEDEMQASKEIIMQAAKENPLKTLLIAAGIGLLLLRGIFGRRS
ncbi:Uncharacterised protein [Legionella donaldsonii]|uniref:DUF883 domain-containing protein n=1 Tax=Legionella donaldsonii TaxID=45060 RepID=A0A378J3S0_9GAMM|nr:hypothetical protein [Legionella donaldsonii]STX41888.1 Uncharacterised protein [Legionella donaldsonii]